MSTVSANATGLPSITPMLGRTTPRRGFLAGLASLPLLGGSVALAGRADAPDMADADQLASFDDYADARFEALVIDFDKVRNAYNDMWTPLAMSLKVLTKSSDGCRDIAAKMGDDLEVIDAMIETLRDGAAWYRQAAELIEAAEARYLCGSARLIREGGLDA